MDTQQSLAVLTGASSGIGLELAKQFAQHGFELLLCADSDRIRSVSEEFTRSGKQASFVQADLAKPEGVRELYETVQARRVAPEVLAVNAGIGIGDAFLNRPWEDALQLLQLNVISSVHLTRLIVPNMVARRRGRVLFTASIAGIMPTPFEAVYGASKAFLLSFSASLREELKGTGVTVTALMPGPTETNFFHRAGLDDTKVGKQEKDDPADVARQAFEATMAGKDRVIAASLKTKLLGSAARFMPEALKAKLHRDMSQPGSA